MSRCVRLIRDLGDEVPSPHTKPEIPLWKANCNKDHRGCRRPMPTFGWGKHSVRLYAGRTRRGRAPAPLVDTSSVSFPLPPAAGLTLTTLCLLSKRDPLRWALVWARENRKEKHAEEKNSHHHRKDDTANKGRDPTPGQTSRDDNHRLPGHLRPGQGDHPGTRSGRDPV